MTQKDFEAFFGNVLHGLKGSSIEPYFNLLNKEKPGVLDKLFESAWNLFNYLNEEKFYTRDAMFKKYKDMDGCFEEIFRHIGYDVAFDYAKNLKEPKFGDARRSLYRNDIFNSLEEVRKNTQGQIDRDVKEKPFNERMADFVQLLESTRSKFNNSKEFDDIVKDIRKINDLLYVEDHNFQPTDNQEKALKLLQLNMKIDKYILHKAKDGVNANAYSKLAAIQKLSEEISKEYKKLNYTEINIMYGGQERHFNKDNNHIYGSYAEYYDSIKNSNDKLIIPEKLSKEKKQEMASAAKEILKTEGLKVDADKYMAVDDFMCKIIACSKMNDNGKRAAELSKVRQSFNLSDKMPKKEIEEAQIHI